FRSVLAGLDGSDFQQLEIQLIHENGGLPRVRRPLASYPASRHPAQFGIKGGHQLPGRFLIAATEALHKFCDPAQILLLGILERHSQFPPFEGVTSSMPAGRYCMIAIQGPRRCSPNSSKMRSGKALIPCSSGPWNFPTTNVW